MLDRNLNNYQVVREKQITATLKVITPAALTLSKTVAWSNFLPRSLKIVSGKSSQTRISVKPADPATHTANTCHLYPVNFIMERAGQTTLLLDGRGQLSVWTQGSLRSEPDRISMIKHHLWFSVTEAEFRKRNLA